MHFEFYTLAQVEYKLVLSKQLVIFSWKMSDCNQMCDSSTLQCMRILIDVINL